MTNHDSRILRQATWATEKFEIHRKEARQHTEAKRRPPYPITDSLETGYGVHLGASQAHARLPKTTWAYK